MNNGKRVNAAKKAAVKPKGKQIRKFKTVKKLNKKQSVTLSPTNKVIPQFPVIPKTEFGNVVPCYNSVLTRTEQDGITMSELNQLQSDVEKLLSTCAVRQHLLFKEAESLKRQVNRGKKGKFSFKKDIPVKRRRLEPKIKVKDPKISIRSKNKCVIKQSKNVRKKRNLPKVGFPKNDTSEKFWLSVEAFCAPVTKDDSIFLEDLIKDCSTEKVSYSCPEGEHYSKAWTEELLTQEQNQSCPQRTAKIKPNGQSKIEKYDFNRMIDTFSSPLSQRLLGVLVENNLADVETKSKETRREAVKRFNNPKNRICMEKLLEDELYSKGIFTILEMSKGRLFEINPLLLELHNSCIELKAISEQNKTELTKLRKAVDRDLKMQEIKEELSKVDTEIKEIYGKLITLHQSKPTINQCTEPNDLVEEIKKCQDQAKMLIERQLMFENQLNELEG